MRKTEQKLWDRMRKHIGGVARLERIENLVGDGIPDVLALHCGRVTFCELKAIDRSPARATTPVLGTKHGLRTSQRNWHMSWAAQAGRSCVVVGIGGFTLFVLPGHLADHINSYTYAELELAAIARSWPEFFNYLRGDQ